VNTTADVEELKIDVKNNNPLCSAYKKYPILFCPEVEYLK